MESAPPNDSVFAELQVLLDLAGMSSQQVPKHPEAPLEQLLVLLDPDEQGNTLALRLSWLEDIVDLGFDSLQAGVGEHETYTLEFHLPIPMQVPQEKLGEVAHLTQAYSRTLFFGVIGYMPREGLFFRYCLPQLNREVQAELTAQLLSVIATCVQGFTTRLAALLEGQPLAALLAEMKG